MKKSSSNRMGNEFKKVTFRDVIEQTNIKAQHIVARNVPTTPPSTLTMASTADSSESAVSLSCAQYFRVVMIVVVLSLMAWNVYTLSTLMHTLSSGEWSYTMYFDDSFNFIENKHIFSFFPFHQRRLVDIISHTGINVYEPIGSLLKAAIFDLHGHESTHFRLWSVVFHFVNGIFVSVWTMAVLRTRRCIPFSVLVAVSVSVGSVYMWHPLNVEVIAWVSAQSYTLALTFYMLACLLFERLLFLLQLPSTSTSSICQVSAGILATYALACFSKAPAITLPAILLLRSLLLPLPLRSSASTAPPSPSRPPSLHKRLNCFFVVLFAATALLWKVLVIANTEGTQSAVTTYTRLDTKLARAILTTWNFFERVIVPSDLRVHYVLPPQSELTASALLNMGTADSNSSPIYGHNSLYLYSILLGCILTSVLVLRRKRYPVMAFSWLSYLAAWVPGVGFVSHGWSTLGSDRYCYLPLAMLVPGVAEGVCCALLGWGRDEKKDNRWQQQDEKKQQPKKTSTQRKSETTDDAPEFSCALHIWLAVTVLCLLVAHKTTFSANLLSWRNDKSLTEACLRSDPSDWNCHYILSQHYYNYENDSAMHTVHHDLAILFMPDGEPKALLSKAGMHVEVGNYEDACAIYREMYANVDDTETKYQPYVINNYVACNAFNGVDFRHRQMASIELSKALRIIKQVGTLPSYVESGVVDHLAVIHRHTQQAAESGGATDSISGGNYGVDFLF